MAIILFRNVWIGSRNGFSSYSFSSHQPGTRKSLPLPVPVGPNLVSRHTTPVAYEIRVFFHAYSVRKPYGRPRSPETGVHQVTPPPSPTIVPTSATGSLPSTQSIISYSAGSSPGQPVSTEWCARDRFVSGQHDVRPTHSTRRRASCRATTVWKR